MTQDEIIEMAKQAGFSLGHNVTDEYANKLEAFAKLVAAKEREACANVCEELFTVWVRESKEFDDEYPAPLDCAEAIRARGEA